MSDIRIITEPSVYLIGTQQVDESELQRLLRDNGIEQWSTDTDEGGQRLVEIGGRACYWSFAKPRPGGNKAYIEHLLEVKHGSCLEHAVYTLLITGVSRSLTHELVRHRVGMSPSQLSQRFVDESKGDMEVVVPPLVKEASRFGFEEADRDKQILASEVYQAWHSAMVSAARSYELLSLKLYQYLGQAHPELDGTAKTKAAREAARSVLPNATETKLQITINARALRHFLELRGSEAADAEIRRLALAIHGVMVDQAPHIFGDYEVRQGECGAYLHTDFRHV